MQQILRRLTWLLLVLAFLPACEKDLTPLAPEAPPRQGEILNTFVLEEYTPADIQQILSDNGLQLVLPLNYTVRVVHIEYRTIDFRGEFINASGALAVPQTERSFPLLSIQHGTVTRRDQVASVHPLNLAEGLVGVIMASSGYVTAMPDYPGLGVSTILHPYIHAKSLGTAVVDFLRASRIYCRENGTELNGQVFLTGYSEGGYATMATQKEIETHYAGEFSLTAVAPMAGPYDVVGTFEQIARNEVYNWPANLAFFITAYDHIYGWNRLTEIFRSPYGEMMPDLFDGTKSFGEINSLLPTQLFELFNRSVTEAYFAGGEEEFRRRLTENSLLDWTPRTPIRMFHGSADETVPYQNSLTALDRLKANGAVSIELITIPGGTHSSAALISFLGMMTWFNSFAGV